MRRSRQTGPCWRWGGTIKDGYGIEHGHHAHRVVYEKLIGPIPDGHDLHHHHCRNTWCVNPWHMKPLLATIHAQLHARPGPRVESCPAGHDYTPENTYEYTRKDGRLDRHCRTCHRDLMYERDKPTRRTTRTGRRKS